ncbi:MAG: mucin-associated surface protein [Verrucomicrobia bacterium]|nr:mucin-associated surface protein [Verrucomicrobiota bacterium]
MVTEKIKELKATQARMAELEKSIATQLAKELIALPGKYGFSTTEEFIAALKASGGTRGPGRRKAAPAAKKAGGKRRKRAIITPEIKAQVKSLTQAGKTGAEIAKAAGISLPSVQNIKKALGLVKARK